MRGPPAAVKITLTSAQRTVLERWDRQRVGPRDRVRRARILLMAAAGESNTAIGRAVGLSTEAAHLWRTRWREGEVALAEATSDDLDDVMNKILADAPRSGAPATFAPEQVAQIIAVACESPKDSDRPVSHWTPRELAAEVILRGIVKTISIRHVGRFFLRRP
jgi:putative transposase